MIRSHFTMSARMVARYAPPISYNFLNLIRLDGNAKTIFEQVFLYCSVHNLKVACHFPISVIFSSLSYYKIDVVNLEDIGNCSSMIRLIFFFFFEVSVSYILQLYNIVNGNRLGWSLAKRIGFRLVSQ